jgi:hypothetical protein
MGAGGYMKVVTMLCVMAMVLLGCSETPGGGQSAETVGGETRAGDSALLGCGVMLGSFSDGTWEFMPDRVWDKTMGDVQFPTDPLSEEAYEAVENSTDVLPVLIVVSKNGDLVTIGESTEGNLTSSATDIIHYNLDAGTFAGGRFLVWIDDDCFQAELTIYGSGVPVVSSERGRLYPTD